MEKVFISHGDIILDNIYDCNLNLLKQDGGGCNWNDLYNLAYMGETCYAFGSAGNDGEGQIAINSLKKLGINVEGINIEDKPTNIMNIIFPNQDIEDDNILHSWYSPITNKLTMTFSENMPTTLPEELLDKEVYIILDKFMPVNLELIGNIKNKKVCLDVGHIRFFEHFSRQYILNFFKTANYMQLNDSVIDMLYERLNVHSEAELFNLLDLDLLVLTRGKKGATFVFKENDIVQTIHKRPEILVSAVDTSGAGDAFFSTMVREYAYADNIDVDFINRTFELANKSSREILSKLGSRK